MGKIQDLKMYYNCIVVCIFVAMYFRIAIFSGYTEVLCYDLIK